MDAQDTRSLYRSVPGAPGNRSGASFSSQGFGTADLCDSIEEQIDRINARMRQPYRSGEGELLRERLLKLSRQRYEAKCIR